MKAAQKTLQAVLMECDDSWRTETGTAHEGGMLVSTSIALKKCSLAALSKVLADYVRLMVTFLYIYISKRIPEVHCC